jgi:hypothetical protein
MSREDTPTICIYCPETRSEQFTAVEHVIQQSFGTFADQTPTLRCVCDGCNAYFKKELDQVFARETIEGITRYQKGIFSRESRQQTFNLNTYEIILVENYKAPEEVAMRFTPGKRPLRAQKMTRQEHARFLQNQETG